jgi:hypothetical protein
MAFGFRKSFKVAPGLRLNVSRRSVGISAGRRGATVSASSSGRRRASLGWRGLFWRKQLWRRGRVQDPAWTDRFYMPDPDLFRHPNAYSLYTRYAAQLQEAGLAAQFPADAELRKVAIELLAERHAVEYVIEHPEFIADAVKEARDILDERRSG